DAVGDARGRDAAERAPLIVEQLRVVPADGDLARVALHDQRRRRAALDAARRLGARHEREGEGEEDERAIEPHGPENTRGPTSLSSELITERSEVTVGRHLPPSAGAGTPSRSGATHVIVV